jgi:hypothetical protein
MMRGALLQSFTQIQQETDDAERNGTSARTPGSECGAEDVLGHRSFAV